MKLQVGVKALIKNDAGQYLFMERSKILAGDTEPSWDIPGGRIEPEEELAEALSREIKEETGMDLQGELELLDAQDIVVPQADLHVVRLTYRAQATGELRLSDEHTVYRWLSLKQATDLNVERYLGQTLSGLSA